MRRPLVWITMVLVGASGAGIITAGCGDDTSGAPGGGQDAAADSTTGSDSNTTAPDAQPDQTTADAAGEGGDAAAEGGAETGNDASLSCVVPDAAGLDAASVEAGFYAVWQVYKCNTCHQRRTSPVDDAGNGIVLSGNNDGLGDSGTIFPPNLTDDPTTGLGCWSDNDIVSAILHGTDRDGGSLCPSMPKWGDALMNVPPDGGIRTGTPMSQMTAQAIVDFLRSLPPVTNEVMDTTCAMMPEGGALADAGDGSAGAADADAGSAGDSSDQ